MPKTNALYVSTEKKACPGKVVSLNVFKPAVRQIERL
jgi:hypothetical protein